SSEIRTDENIFGRTATDSNRPWKCSSEATVEDRRRDHCRHFPHSRCARPATGAARRIDEQPPEPPSVAPSITFEGMRDFVPGYYGDLPPPPYDAWAKLSPRHDQTPQPE